LPDDSDQTFHHDPAQSSEASGHEGTHAYLRSVQAKENQFFLFSLNLPLFFVLFFVTFVSFVVNAVNKVIDDANLKT
jgi:hypothetical protein